MQVVCKQSFDTRRPEGRFSMKKGKSGNLPDVVAEQLIRAGLVRPKKGGSHADDTGGQDNHGPSSGSD